MKERLLLLVCLILLLSLLPGVAQPAWAAEGACLAWDITGEWAYSASLGGWGTLNFQQVQLDERSGSLSGTWHNRANGGTGSFEDGGIINSAVGFHPTPGDTWRGTVSADGTVIQGDFASNGESGYWRATGQARCRARQPIPPEGSARATVRWGDYVYRLALKGGTRPSALKPEEVTKVQRIVGPFGVTLLIEAVYYGEDLPNSLKVENEWYVVGGPGIQLDYLSNLNRAGTTADGGVIYRGRVTVPQRELGPGERIENYVDVVDPWGFRETVAIIDQLIVDPSGYIYDADTNERIQGAMVSCYVKKGSSWVLWDAGAWKQTNPLVSNEVGHYGWDVPQGDYKVLVSHDCYQDAESPVVTVPPPRTDVHFALKKVSCSALELTDVWTADDGAVPKLQFLASQPIQYHVQVENSGTSAVTVQLAWTVADPDGKRVDALSGSGLYNIADFGAKLAIDETLPPDLSEGSYKLTIQFTHQQQTSMQVTQFWVQARQQVSVYLPLVGKNLGGTTTPPGIYGRVMNEGKAVSGIELRLRFYDGSSWSTAGTTRTDGAGRYLFTGLSSLGSGQKYYVRYGPNSSSPEYLHDWRCPEITSYSAGAPGAGGDFDIANVDLLSPSSGSTVSLPATFKWRQRGLAGDSYRWRLLDPTADRSWRSNDLGDMGSFTLHGLPEALGYGKEYRWEVLVFRGPDSWGSSYYYRRVTFSPSQGQTTQPQMVRPWTPREPDSFGAGRQGE
jgi:hypothetical protein